MVYNKKNEEQEDRSDQESESLEKRAYTHIVAIQDLDRTLPRGEVCAKTSRSSKLTEMQLSHAVVGMLTCVWCQILVLLCTQ